MTRLVSAALGAAITVALGCAAHAQSFAVGGVVGTAGLGAEVQMKANSWLVLRGAADFADQSARSRMVDAAAESESLSAMHLLERRLQALRADTSKIALRCGALGRALRMSKD